MDLTVLNGDPVAILARHGKTFRWAGRFLPASGLQRAARLYRLLRFLDDLADEEPARGDGAALLRAIYHSLHAGSGTETLPVQVRAELEFLQRTRRRAGSAGSAAQWFAPGPARRRDRLDRGTPAL